MVCRKKSYATMQRYKIIDFIENFLHIRKPQFFKYSALLVKSSTILGLRTVKKVQNARAMEKKELVEGVDINYFVPLRQKIFRYGTPHKYKRL